MNQRKIINEKEVSLKKPYNYGPYNKCNDSEQWIRISEGCPHNCPYCYEPIEIKTYGIPEIVRNEVSVMDMNLLCKSEALEIIKELGTKRVNGKVVHYNMICGIDYRFLTQEIANALKQARFLKIRIGWDWYYEDQLKIRNAIQILLKAGYKSEHIMVFMIRNWRIPYSENSNKLNLLKIWNVQVADCYYDGQISPDITPLYWTQSEIKNFRRKCRKHNQLVNFKIDPELRRLQ